MRGWAWGAALLSALALAACGGDDPTSWPQERPRIDEVDFVGQSPRDPLGLQFMLTFVDADGDLGAGRLLLSLDGGEAGQIALDELFGAQRPPLDAAAVSGELEVLVRLAEEPEPGTMLTVGFVLEDTAGNRSNQPTMTMATR